MLTKPRNDSQQKVDTDRAYRDTHGNAAKSPSRRSGGPTAPRTSADPAEATAEGRRATVFRMTIRSHPLQTAHRLTILGKKSGNCPISILV